MLAVSERSASMNFLVLDVSRHDQWETMLGILAADATVVACVESREVPSMMFVRRFIMEMLQRKISNPIVICVETTNQSIDEQLIHFSAEAGSLFLDGMGDGIWLWNHHERCTPHEGQWPHLS